MKKKWLIILGVIILAPFLVLNITWFTFINIKYKPYEEIVPLTEQYGAPAYHMVDTKNPNIQYGFDYPGYLRFESNLFYREKFPEKQTSYSFIVWPKLFSSPKYGVIIRTDKEEYHIELNEDMEIYGKDKDNEYSEQIIKEHKEQLTSIFIEMKETFHLK